MAARLTDITRRRMLVASGAALAATSPVVLAACGAEDDDEPTSPAREAELLNAVLAQQLAVIEAARAAGRNAPAQAAPAVELLRKRRETSTQGLEAAISALDGTAIAEPAPTIGGESAVEGLARQLEESIAGSIAAIGELTPERRQLVQRAISEDAAALAAMRATLGEQIAPDAFVMGPPSAQQEASE